MTKNGMLELMHKRAIKTKSVSWSGYGSYQATSTDRGIIVLYCHMRGFPWFAKVLIKNVKTIWTILI